MKKLFKLTLLALTALTLSGCAVFYDTGGDNELRFARTDQVTFTEVLKEKKVDRCDVDINLNGRAEYYAIEVSQWETFACTSKAFTYSLFAVEDGEILPTPEFEAKTLQGHDRGAWILYSNFSEYILKASYDDTEVVVYILQQDGT